MSKQRSSFLPFSGKAVRSGLYLASEPERESEDHSKRTPSASPDVLLDQVASKEIGFDEFLVLVTEQALIVTAAAGAALALRSDNSDAVVCRARIGETAPSLGCRLNTQTGLSGECVRTGQSLRCDDTDIDPRVDARACRELRVRSIAAVPLCLATTPMGILEVFSPSPCAFSDSDIEILTKLADVATAAMQRLAHDSIAVPQPPLPWPGASASIPTIISKPGRNEEALQAIAEPVSQIIEKQRKGLPSSWTWLYWAVPGGVAAIVLLSLFFLGWGRRAKVDQPSARLQAESQPAQTRSLNQDKFGTADSANVEGNLATSRTRDQSESHPPVQKRFGIQRSDSVTNRQDDIRITYLPTPKPLVSQSGIERDVPPPTGVVPTREKSTLISSLLSDRESLPDLAQPISRGVTPARLEHKVEPIYPAQARELRIAGEVKLRTTVGADGKVRDVQIITGNPLLVRAAVEAVRQWRYKPSQLNNEPVAMRTDITVNFKLP